MLSKTHIKWVRLDVAHYVNLSGCSPEISERVGQLREAGAWAVSVLEMSVCG